jgi:ParB family chromosome partitioning protein
MTMPERRPALGRGLSALIPDPPPEAPTPVPGSSSSPTEVDLDLLRPNEEQPRTDMDDARLDDLARSISTSGVIQPILVRPRSEGAFEIVAGERRWRAAQRAGLMRVPVIVKDVPVDKRLELALVENIQRENLNPIEEARAYRRLADQFHQTQEEIAHAVGKDRATVANYQRLLTLPTELQADVATGGLSMGHARALIGLPDQPTQRRVARDVRARDLSVRETEALVKKLVAPQPPSLPPAEKDVHTRAAEEQLRVALGTRVRISRARRGGTIDIQFNSEEELQRLYERLTARLLGQDPS